MRALLVFLSRTAVLCLRLLHSSARDEVCWRGKIDSLSYAHAFPECICRGGRPSSFEGRCFFRVSDPALMRALFVEDRWSRLPLEGLYVRDGFGLGDFRFAVVQVEQAIFPVAHSQLVHI